MKPGEVGMPQFTNYEYGDTERQKAQHDVGLIKAPLTMSAR